MKTIREICRNPKCPRGGLPVDIVAVDSQPIDAAPDKWREHRNKWKLASNADAWAIGSQRRNGFSVRKIVWGLLMAQYERRDGEQIRAAQINVERELNKRRRQTPPECFNPFSPRFKGPRT